jgi:hypothetical protein
MSPFDIIRIMIEEPENYKNISGLDKRKNFFIITRRLSIQFPLQSHVLQHLKIDEVNVIDFWQTFLSNKYKKVPYWMYTKGVKKVKESKEDKEVSEKLIREYAIFIERDTGLVKKALEFFPEKMKKELQEFKNVRHELEKN